MSGQDDSALPAMQRAARQLPPGWEIGALIPGTLTREVLHPDWRGTPVTLHISDDHPMRLTWTCGAVSVREFGDFARTSLSDYPELMRLIRPAPPPEDVVEREQRAAFVREVERLTDELADARDERDRAIRQRDKALSDLARANGALSGMHERLSLESHKWLGANAHLQTHNDHLVEVNASLRSQVAEAGLCRELIAERDALRAELRLTVDAEVGRAGPPGWEYADTGDRLWTCWLGPKDESDEETFPLLRAEHDLSGRWAWEVLGPGYVNMARGVSDGALAAMRACEQAVGSVVLAAVRTSGREGE